MDTPTNLKSIDALLAVHELAGGPGSLPQGRIDLWLGDGALGFLPSPVFAGLALPDADGIHPRWGALGDVNGDGLVDALYTAADSLAFPPGSLLNEQPVVVLTLLLGAPGGDLLASAIPTSYAGKGVAPLLIDLAPVPGDGLPDCVLVWSQDTLAGKADERTRLGDLDVAEHGVGGRNPARRRVGEHDHVGNAGILEQ